MSALARIDAGTVRYAGKTGNIDIRPQRDDLNSPVRLVVEGSLLINRVAYQLRFEGDVPVTLRPYANLSRRDQKPFEWKPASDAAQEAADLALAFALDALTKSGLDLEAMADANYAANLRRRSDPSAPSAAVRLSGLTGRETIAEFESLAGRLLDQDTVERLEQGLSIREARREASAIADTFNRHVLALAAYALAQPEERWDVYYQGASIGHVVGRVADAALASAISLYPGLDIHVRPSQ